MTVLLHNDSWRSKLPAALREGVVVFGEDLSSGGTLRVSLHSHQWYQLDYFTGGTARIVVGGADYSAMPGDVFVSNPGEEHSIEIPGRKNAERLMLKFAFGSKDIPVFPNRLANISALPEAQQRELDHYLRRSCAKSIQCGEEHVLLATALLTSFFLSLLEYSEETGTIAHRVPRGELSRRVTEYIRRHYSEPLDLSGLARVFGLNPQYLCHRFCEEVGIPPMAALTRERMEIAKRLLSNTRLPIAEVGTRVGYPDIYHFSKRFKSVVGVSPMSFREND